MAKYRKKPIVVTAIRADQDQYIATLEGVSEAKRGDYIVTGIDNEQWAIKPEWFTPTYTHIQGDTYQRKPQVLDAVQIDKPEVSSAPTGDIIGRPGDYRVTGKSGEQWYVKPDIFAKTYEKVGKSMNGLEKAIRQIGYDSVAKSIPVGAKIGRCDIHGAYLVPLNSTPTCPSCPILPPANGQSATTTELYIDIKDAISPTSGTNPGQKSNPTAVSEQDIISAKQELDKKE